MSLSIGFSNKYYTLWDVCQTEETSGSQEYGYKTYIKVHYNYLQNLSIDEEKAKSKATELGCKNLNVNEDLYGRNRSWVTKINTVSELPKDLSPFFEFGKYVNELISECSDISYLSWYYNETKNRYAKNILLANGYKELGFDIVSKEKYDEAMNIEMVNNILREEKFIDVVAEGNLKVGDDIAYRTFDYMGVNVNFIFNQFKEMYYQGFTYALPLINGSAKKIKGKKIRLYFEAIQNGFQIEYLVNKVEILN